MVSEVNDSQGVLAGVKVVDLAHPYGQYCGKVLADLGADVVKIEPPVGDPARHIGPFKGDVPNPETSLFFAFYNSNKRSLRLDLKSERGREAFNRLVGWADAVIETPEHSLSFGYDDLSKLNPKVIVASIFGFRKGGPYESYRSTPVVAFALSGIMKSIGPPEGPPEAAPGQMGFDLAAVDAASGIVASLLMRETSGRGQHVTAAAHETLASEINPRAPEQFDDSRHHNSINPQMPPTGMFDCADGKVTMFINLPGHWQGIKELIGSPPEFDGPEWDDRSYRQVHAEFVNDIVAKGLATMTREEAVKRGQSLRVPIGPVNSVESFAKDPQPESRGYFAEIAHPVLGSYKMPGPPYRMSEAGWALRRPAPTLGQHSREVLQELGYSGQEADVILSEAKDR